MSTRVNNKNKKCVNCEYVTGSWCPKQDRPVRKGSPGCEKFSPQKVRMTFILRHDRVVKTVIGVLNNMPMGVEHEVIIRPAEESIRDAQRRLYYLWRDHIANHYGWEKRHTHLYLKKHYLVPIMEAKDPGYAEVLRTVNEVHLQGLVSQAKSLADLVVEKTSINDAGVDGARQFLSDVERFAAEQEIALPFPAEFERYENIR